jgi:hypothetical protein
MSSPHFNLLSTPRHPDPAKDKWATDYVNLKGNYLVLAEGSEQIEDEESSQTEKFEKGAYNCLGWATNKQEILGHWSFWEKDALKQRCECLLPCTRGSFCGPFPSSRLITPAS